METVKIIYSVLRLAKAVLLIVFGKIKSVNTFYTIYVIAKNSYVDCVLGVFKNVHTVQFIGG